MIKMLKNVKNWKNHQFLSQTDKNRWKIDENRWKSMIFNEKSMFCQNSPY